MDCVLIAVYVCVSPFMVFVSAFMCECASLYGNQCVVCMCVLVSRMMSSEGVVSCVASRFHVIASLSPAKQVVVSAFFICM